MNNIGYGVLAFYRLRLHDFTATALQDANNEELGSKNSLNDAINYPTYEKTAVHDAFRMGLLCTGFRIVL